MDDPSSRPDFGVMLAAVAATRVEVSQLAEPARSEAMADLADVACDILATV